ncbi:MAG: AhpC/TSA family protein [Odoribacteraceae bacterium]|jgi:thiol-disulfide isomerase/thioredoxin|nr:AhpC/TSA family protein [Odoribacteraceae bacterium]
MRNLLPLACALICCACAGNKFTLTGNLQGLPDDTPVAIIPAATHQEEPPTAETTLQGGRFTIRGVLPSPRLFYLQVGERPTVAREAIFLEPGKITFEAEVIANSSRWRWDNPRVSGSASHRLYLEKTRFREDLNARHAAMQQKHREISARISRARAAKDTALYAALSRSPEYRAMETDENLFFRDAGKGIRSAIVSNGDSFWGPLLALLNYIYFTPGDTSATRLYEAFSDKAKESYYGQIMHRELFSKRLVGRPLPSFSLPDRDGTLHTPAFPPPANSDGTPPPASSPRPDRRLVIIDFWASWCAPCRREIPRLKELHAAYAPLGLEIISISIDKDPAAWRVALDDEQMPWLQLLDADNVFTSLFFGRVIPTLFLVDSSGAVIEDRLLGPALASFLQDYFAPVP